jgi:uncharacterized protein (TIRG00374 family)
LERQFLLKSKRFWIGGVITIVTLGLAFQGIQFDKLLESFAQFNWVWLPFLIAVFMLSYAGRAFRWQALFHPYQPRWLRVFDMLNIGYLLNNVTPARIGDLARAYLLGAREKIPVARALSTVVVERALDGLTVVLFLLIMLPFTPRVPEEYVRAALILGAVGLSVLFALAIISYQQARGIAFLQRLAKPFPFLRREGLWRFVEQLLAGFAVIRAPRPLLKAIFWSIEVWFVASVLSWLTMLAMGVDAPLIAGFWVQVATALVVTVAATPGQLGAFHLTAVFVMTTLFGADNNQALAYAFVMHGLTYLMLTLLGIISTLREGIDLAKIQELGASNHAIESAPFSDADNATQTASEVPLENADGAPPRAQAQASGTLDASTPLSETKARARE